MPIKDIELGSRFAVCSTVVVKLCSLLHEREPKIVEIYMVKMTYTGKPSRGCKICRNAHVKCDEGRPHCSRCLRLNERCHGYRDDVSLIFRVERGTPKSKEHRRPKSTERISTAGHWQPSLTKILLPSRDHQALCYFFQFTIPTMGKWDHSLYLHQQLPLLLSRSAHSSALYLAAQAISYAVWAKYMCSDARMLWISRKCYVKSISALNTAIRNPNEVKSDETLYAVFLLSGYENITFESTTQSAWKSHTDGAAALLKIRGKEHLSTPMQCTMFLWIRRQTVQLHIQLGRAVDPVFNELAQMVIPFENTEDRLLSTTIKVPQLQFLANDILSSPKCSTSAVNDIIRTAEKIDLELKNWASNVSAEWRPSAAIHVTSNSSECSSSYYLPTETHKYSDFYVARVWNLYRVSRLIIQSILLRTSSWLKFSLTDGSHYLHHIQKITSLLVNDICATVPFLLGFDISQLNRQILSIGSQTKTLWPQNTTGAIRNAGHTGRFSLVWPLYLACSAFSIPELQRRWMRAQLKWIAEQDEPHAELASQTLSQTLFGKPEDFTFDCV